MADMKTAAYLCAGCDIGTRLDLAALHKVAEREGKMGLVREHAMLCSSEGVQLIRDEVAAEGLTHVVLGACSRRAKTEAFFFPELALSRANLREGVIWCQPETEAARETTQEMAEDYVRMACAEVRRMKVPAPNVAARSARRLLVVGGGVSGLTAVHEAALAGYPVLLLEKTGQLGGWAARLWKRIPVREPYDGPVETGLPALIDVVRSDPNVEILLGATLARTAGAPGRFEVDIVLEGGGTRSETVGAIVQASGFVPYDATRLPEFAFGATPNVVDQAGLERLAVEAAAAGRPILRPADGAAVRSVVFVQCAGQRDTREGHLPYCSGFCCAASVKQALYFKDANPEVDTVVIYTDLRLPGSQEDFYRSAQRKGVTFTKGRVTKVEKGGQTSRVHFHDLILDQAATVDDVDIVVLATGQVPQSGVDIEGAEPAEGVEQPVSILNLAYRQGRDLPQLKYGFTDSHFICFPYETRRTGIYAAGPVRRPMDMAQAMEDATGAALKAIQAVENAAAGRAAHPRSGDLSYPQVRLDGCTQCKRCTVECPFGAIDEDEKRYPVFNESRCRRCGTCMGACPVRVISFENYSVETVGAQIKAVEVPDEFSEKPRILILACENDAYPALDMAGMQRRVYSAFVRVIPVRCLGSVNTIWITDAFNAGYDGIMMMGCQKGVDYQCHFIKGSELAFTRMSKIDDTLKQMALEPERLTTLEVAITDRARVPELIEAYAARIGEIGLSPLKGFA